MGLVRNTFDVPTGNILIIKGDYGLLECLSIGDYGKLHNVKADFMGITRELNGVPNGEVMPLQEKWVITLSSQYGCSMGCKFCDVPKVGPGINATFDDLKKQVFAALSLRPDVKKTKRLNIHYARMGEPTFNRNVLRHAMSIKSYITPFLSDSLVHPVVSTMLPKHNGILTNFLMEWCDIKNSYFMGDAGLQFSINSTSDDEREAMFNNNSLSLYDISKIGEKLPMPKGRKYAINIALADGVELDAAKMAVLFDNEKFMVKITPMHKTSACNENSIGTAGGYNSYTPYTSLEESLKKYGFDVLVFVPSLDEDESRITCGNAILAGVLKN